MFNRFVGQKKPTVTQEEKPFDMTPMTNHMDNLNKREDQILKKIENIDQQLATYLIDWSNYC